MASFGDDYGQAGFRTAMMGMEMSRKFDLENQTRDSLKAMETGATERPEEMNASAWQAASEKRADLRGKNIQNDTGAQNLKEKLERDEFAKGLMVSMANGDPGALLKVVNKHDTEFMHMAEKDPKTGNFSLNLMNRKTGEIQPFMPYQDGRPEISIKEIGHAYSAGVFGSEGITGAGKHIAKSGITPADVAQANIDYFHSAEEDVSGKWTAIDRRGTRRAIDKSEVPVSDFRKNRPALTEDTGTQIRQGIRDPVSGAMVAGSTVNKEQLTKTNAGTEEIFGTQNRTEWKETGRHNIEAKPGSGAGGANAANAARRIDNAAAAAIEKSMQGYHEAYDAQGNKVINQPSYQREVRHALNIANALKGEGVEISGPDAAAIARMHGEKLHKNALAETAKVKKNNPTFFDDEKITEAQYAESLVDEAFSALAAPLERSAPRAMNGKGDPKEGQPSPAPASREEFNMSTRGDKDSVKKNAKILVGKQMKDAANVIVEERRNQRIKDVESEARQRQDPLQQMIDTRNLMKQLRELKEAQVAPKKGAMLPGPSRRQSPVQFENRNL